MRFTCVRIICWGVAICRSLHRSATMFMCQVRRSTLQHRPFSQRFPHLDPFSILICIIPDNSRRICSYIYSTKHPHTNQVAFGWRVMRYSSYKVKLKAVQLQHIQPHSLLCALYIDSRHRIVREIFNDSKFFCLHKSINDSAGVDWNVIVF